MRKIYKLSSCAKPLLFAIAFSLLSVTAYSQTTTFFYTGSPQTITLPAGNYSIACWGADGGTLTANTALPGKGGYSSGNITLTAATTFSVYVGGRGNGGAQPLGGFNSGNGTTKTNITTATGGGGASDVRVLVDDYFHRIIVAGGGGGQGTTTGTGGHGGGLSGQNGQGTTNFGIGGTQTAPGLYPPGGDAKVATFGEGGDGPAGTTGGQGGGGWYGGSFGTRTNGGGAGGSGYVLTSTSYTPTGYFSPYSNFVFTNTVTTMSGASGFVSNPDLTGHGRVTITSLCNLAIVNSAASAPICSGSSATLTSDAIGNYSWSNGGTTATIVVSPPVTTQYTLTATSPQNCTTSAVVTVSVITGVPTLTAVASSSAVCAGVPIVFTASGASTYTWTNGVTNAVSYTPTATNIFTVTGQNACGTSTAAVGVTVFPAPTVTASVNTPTVCNGGSVIFTGGGNATNYVWSSGVVNNVAYFPGATSDYTLVGSANNCSTTAVVGVTVLVTPTITPIVTPTAICVGATATLSATGATGYTWTPGTALNSFTAAVSPPGPTTYTLNRTNGTCASTSTVFLMVNPLPGLNATGTPAQICAGTGVNLNVIGAITYTWMPGAFTSSNFTVYPNNSTCYTVTGSNGSCTATAPVCVTVNPSPLISITTPTTTICEGTSLSLTTTGASNFTWSPSGGVNNSTEVVSPGTTTIISVNGTNAFGCSGSASQLIVVNPRPNANIVTAIPAFICANESAALSVVGEPNVTYSWSNGGNTPTINVNPPITTNYVITATNNITGCTNSGSYSLSVYISTFAVTSPTAICKGENAVMTAVGPATSYSWTANGGTIAPSVTVAPIINTTYYVTGTTGNCASTVTVPLVVDPLPNVTASVDKATICRFETATITGAGATTYSWSNNSTAQVLTFTLSITSTYTLTGTDTRGCSKTTTVTQYVAVCQGLEDMAADAVHVNIYPNPNNGTFNITSDENISLDITNALGQLITTINLSGGKTEEVTVDKLPTGIYFITGEKNGLKVNKKVVIER